ncbi:MAG: aspartate 1-decarboxylase [Candidatus Omnitrophica bacterium]|nr:aspartate 1-decarboxylase [Candidatus Omnitrophota bacterium]MBF0620017.1 aspartate 1-decarboxylase [Candidatus Omnitrophota bacterium]
MFITFCKSKIGHARVTQAELYYEGSITIDEDIIKAVGIIPGEKVEIFNVNNGARIETYVIAGKSGSGQICLNGPAARLGYVGDKLIIVSYALVTPDEARAMKTTTVHLDDANRIKA